LSPGFRTVLVSTQTDIAALAGYLTKVSLTPVGLAAYAKANPTSTEVDCVSAIFLASSSAAATALKAIQSGTSFAAVAKADSEDPTTGANGGALTCGQALEFGQPYTGDLEALATGQVSKALATSDGYVLLEITSRRTPTTLEVLEALEDNVASAEDSLLAKAEASAAVSVDPEYGTWRSVNGAYQVVPPSGPPAADIQNSTAITPPTIPVG
jgi:hypothetical protein